MTYVPITRAQKALTPKETNALAARLPDPVVREELIEGCRPLVIYIVHQVLLKLPAKVKQIRGDLLSAGFLGLIEAVNQLLAKPDKPNDNPAGYIGVAIQNHVYWELRKHHQWKTRTTKYSSRQVETLTSDLLAREDPSFNAIDIEDFLNARCPTPVNRQVAALRFEGYTYPEISQKMSLTMKQVRIEIQRLRKIFSPIS